MLSRGRERLLWSALRSLAGIAALFKGRGRVHGEIGLAWRADGEDEVGKCRQVFGLGSAPLAIALF